MGIRFRKSINCGIFRINLSKSGIGYSYGVKGYRKTHKTGGGTRTTYSIPGTGISYVKDSKSNMHTKSNTEQVQNNAELKEIDFVGDYAKSDKNCFVDKLNKLCRSNMILKVLQIIFIIGAAIGLIYSSIEKLMLILFAFGCVGAMVLCFRFSIRLEYTFKDEESKKTYFTIQEKMHKMVNVDKLQLLASINENKNLKNNAAVSATAEPIDIKIGTKAIQYLKNDLDVQCFYLKKKSAIVFLPDCLAVLKNNKWHAFNYHKIDVQFTDSTVALFNEIPNDTAVVGYSYEHINKDGTKDKRYKDNRKTTLCKFGTLGLSNDDGLQIIITCSNFNAMQDLYLSLTEYQNTVI